MEGGFLTGLKIGEGSIEITKISHLLLTILSYFVRQILNSLDTFILFFVLKGVGFTTKFE